jgi:hypothetical protein
MAAGWRAGTGHLGRCCTGPRQCSGWRRASVAIIIQGGRDGGEYAIPRVIKHILVILPAPVTGAHLPVGIDRRGRSSMDGTTPCGTARLPHTTRGNMETTKEGMHSTEEGGSDTAPVDQTPDRKPPMILPPWPPTQPAPSSRTGCCPSASKPMRCGTGRVALGRRGSKVARRSRDGPEPTAALFLIATIFERALGWFDHQPP